LGIRRGGRARTVEQKEVKNEKIIFISIVSHYDFFSWMREEKFSYLQRTVRKNSVSNILDNIATIYKGGDV
jgi:hypothetical protein